MIEFYYWPTPNGHKVTMFLEEAGLDYAIHPVDISAGDPFKPDFLAISPNTRMPAIIDTAPLDGGEAIPIFESRPFSAISPTRREGSCRTICGGARPQRSGCFGKSAVSDRWPAKTITSDSTRPRRSRTPSIVM